MSVTTGKTGECCRTVQYMLSDIAGSNDTTFKIDAPGALSAIRGRENTAGFEQIDIQDQNSQNVIYQMQYWQNPRTSATDDAVNICTTGDTEEQKFAQVSKDHETSVQLTMDEAEFADFCNTYDANGNNISDSTFARQQVRAKINELVKKVNENTVDYISSNTGNFRSGSAGPREVTLLNPGNDGRLAPAASGEIEIENSFEDIESPGPYFAIGSGFLRDYVKYQRIACCNNAGTDLSQLDSDLRFYRDRYVDTAIGTDNNILALKPGAVQLFSVQNFVGPIEMFGYDFAKTNMIVEWLGPNNSSITLPVDFALYYDKCGNSGSGKSKWVFTWIARYGFYSLPTDLEANTSPFYGVNGILHFKANCGTETCADIQS